MSLTARRFADKPSQRIALPKTIKVTREESERLPLLERVLLQEHDRHASRLADIRRVADKLDALDPIVRAAQAAGACIDITAVRQGYASHRLSDYGRRVNAVVLTPGDTFSSWRNAKAQNAVANALLAAGWRVVRADAEGSEISRDRLVFMHGQRAVETTCLRQWVPELAELVLMPYEGQWWVLVDITLRMLKAPELFLAQSFPTDYVIHEIPDPALLFQGGVQAADPLRVPRIKLSATAQVRMCGNSVAPAQAEALVRANFAHEAQIYGRAAA